MPEPRSSEPHLFAAAPVSSAIFRVARAHKALAARLLRETGLRPGQELVMMTLWRDGPQRQVDLVRALDSDAPTMVRSIARLEKAGLVARAPDPDDRRASIISATEAGMALRARTLAAWRELERTTVRTLSARHIRDAVDVLGGLEANLAAADN